MRATKKDDGSSSSDYNTIPALSKSNSFKGGSSQSGSIVVYNNSETEKLREQNTLQKFQMKNACKNLLKVDEFLGNVGNK